jgi:DNA (cytosine-5)-methyltransferase 1
MINMQGSKSNAVAQEDGPSFTLNAMHGHDVHAVAVGTTMQVRRLTPVECERLQGFPDDHTAIPWRGRPASECPDGPRYRALGNSMAVPVMSWIGLRISAIENKEGP